MHILSLDMCFMVCICASRQILAHFELFEIVKIQSKLVKNFKATTFDQDCLRAVGHFLPYFQNGEEALIDLQITVQSIMHHRSIVFNIHHADFVLNSAKHRRHISN